MIGTTFADLCDSLLGGIHIGHSASRIKVVDGKDAGWIRSHMGLVMAWLERDCTDRGIGWNPDNAQRLIEIAIRRSARRYPPKLRRLPATRFKKGPPPGVGSEVKHICSRIGLVSCVSCDGKAAEWDAKGLAWCVANKPEMTAWLVRQAKKLNISITTTAALLATNEPILAATIAARAVVHPMTDFVELAIECVIDKAIEIVRERRKPRLPIGDRLPVIITACPRSSYVQLKTVQSIVAAGFTEIHASCEPGTITGPLLPATLHINHEKLGQWRNLLRALQIGIETQADYFITMEDDVELSRGAYSLIKRMGWPSAECGCVQLYSAAKLGTLGYYRPGTLCQLRVQEALDMLGCCALMFSRRAAFELVQWANDQGWRGGVDWTIDNPAEKKAGDTFIGEVLTFRKLDIWIYNPSIADHIGTESTLGHEAGTRAGRKASSRKALAFPGIDADLHEIFKEEWL